MAFEFIDDTGRHFASPIEEPKRGVNSVWEQLRARIFPGCVNNHRGWYPRVYFLKSPLWFVAHFLAQNAPFADGRTYTPPYHAFDGIARKRKRYCKPFRRRFIVKRTSHIFARHHQNVSPVYVDSPAVMISPNADWVSGLELLNETRILPENVGDIVLAD